MDDYIRRGAAIEQFEDSTSAIPEKLARIRIEEIPAEDDVVKVVMCMECRCFQCNIRKDELGNLVVPAGVPKFECRWWCGETDPKGYCFYAKRKDGGTDE